MVVNNLLTSMGYKPVEVALGYAILERDSMSDEERKEMGRRLEELGFELMKDSDTVIVERIKIAVLRFARTERGMKIKLSQALEEELKLPYKTLTGLFSQHENRTIENYFISQRIEYVKELISYNEMSLKEIAFKTGYSSVAYLSKQFAQIVGMTISEFRIYSDTHRNSVTNV
jgi:AraC-like DNA-binding protein